MTTATIQQSEYSEPNHTPFDFLCPRCGHKKLYCVNTSLEYVVASDIQQVGTVYDAPVFNCACASAPEEKEYVDSHSYACANCDCTWSSFEEMLRAGGLVMRLDAQEKDENV